MDDKFCSARTVAPRVDVPSSVPVNHVCMKPWGHEERGYGGPPMVLHTCSCGYDWIEDD